MPLLDMRSQTDYTASVEERSLHRLRGTILRQGVGRDGRAAAAERGHHQRHHAADVRAPRACQTKRCPAFCRATRWLTAVVLSADRLAVRRPRQRRGGGGGAPQAIEALKIFARLRRAQFLARLRRAQAAQAAHGGVAHAHANAICY